MEPAERRTARKARLSAQAARRVHAGGRELVMGPLPLTFLWQAPPMGTTTLCSALPSEQPWNRDAELGPLRACQEAGWGRPHVTYATQPLCASGAALMPSWDVRDFTVCFSSSTILNIRAV